MALPDMGRQLGPLPLGAWVAVVGGGLAIAVYSQRTKPSGVVEYAEEGGGYPGVGLGGSGSFTDTGGPVDATPAPKVITTNDQWGNAAITFLIAEGYDPNVSDSAIRKYLTSAKQSAQEYTLTALALTRFGPPPTRLSSPPAPPSTIPKAPTPPKSVPAPKPPPRKPTPPPAVRRAPYYYRVVPGDNLHKVARKMYNNSARWSEIYNANRTRVSNPDLIFPGQVLLIPGK